MSEKRQIKIANLISDKIWGLTHPIERVKRLGSLGKLDFLDALTRYRKSHPELSAISDLELLTAWQHGRFEMK